MADHVQEPIHIGIQREGKFRYHQHDDGRSQVVHHPGREGVAQPVDGDGPEGEQRDDIYYIWIGLQAVARGNDAARVINEVHSRWKQAGWEVTRHRELANGGVNLAATEPGTGDAYALDSGFEKGPDSYVVGFFNTPCFQSASGNVQFGEIRDGL